MMGYFSYIMNSHHQAAPKPINEKATKKHFLKNAERNLLR